MLKRTPFYDIHKDAGAKLIDFGGFEMPVQYAGIKIEHLAVRNAAGLFDVSHMGEVFVSGPNAEKFLQSITVNDVARLVSGKAQYTAMCYPEGGIVDDIIIYKRDENDFLVVVNASNREKDVAWMLENRIDGVEIDDRSDNYCLLALQGPASAQILAPLTDIDLESIPYYGFATGTVCGFDNVIVSATGYTGEKGFEIYFDQNTAEPSEIWNAIMASGADHGIEPCGLGARDTLRLEMGFALYGNDISDQTNPLEAGLGWITKLDKGEFIGKETLAQVKTAGISRRLVGFVMSDERAIPRAHYVITDADELEIGEVTSGTQSVMLGKGIGMGYVTTANAAPGTTIYIQIRGKQVPAVVQKTPFIKKA